MATKLDYLRDLHEHPHSTGGEAAARLDIPEATVLEAYRRARRQGLVEGDGGRPEKFNLTDAGLAQLRVLQAEANPSPTPSLPTKLEEKFSELEQTVHDTVEDVRGLFSLVDKILTAKGGSASPAKESDDAEIVQDLLDERAELEEKLAKTSRLIEYYATRINLDAFGASATRTLEAREKKLAQGLDPETKQAVLHLVELEEELDKEEGRFFGPREEKVRKLQGEIAELRERLGFADADSGEGQEEETEEAE